MTPERIVCPDCVREPEFIGRGRFIAAYVENIPYRTSDPRKVHYRRFRTRAGRKSWTDRTDRRVAGGITLIPIRTLATLRRAWRLQSITQALKGHLDADT